MRRWLRSHLSYSNVVATMCLALLLGGTAVAIDGAHDSATASKVYACAKKRGGAMRLVKAKTKCRRTEKKVSWAKAGGEPKGAVSFYAGPRCPSGYSVYRPARGRYLVGLPVGGQVGATVGTALAPEENRPVGRHDHAITDPGHSHATDVERTIDAGNVASTRFQGNAATNAVDQTLSTASATTGVTVNPAGAVDGTNAPYVELLVCKKD